MPLPWGGSILAAVEEIEREYAEKRERTHVDAAATQPWGRSILSAVEETEREYAEKRERTHVDAAAPTQRWGGSILAAVEKMEREYAEKRQRPHVDAAAPTQGFEKCSANLTIDDVLGSRSTPCDWYEPRLSKEDWFEESAKLYDLDVGAITDRVRSEEFEESRLSVHVCGSWGQGYAAILRDSQLVPIAAMCKPDSSGVSKSIFCTGLMAVALGVKVASNYQVVQLTFYVPSRYLCNFLVSIWNPYGEHFSSPHPKGKQWKSLLDKDDRGHIEQICQLASSIIFDLNKLRSGGMKYFAVQTVRPRRNKAAQFLANLGEDKDMKFAEIRAHEGLSEILYEDAFF